MKSKIIFFVLFISIISSAQNNDQIIRDGSFNIFIDCDYCDLSYYKEQLSIVNFVRDRNDADVHILYSTQRTGSGGEEYTLFFIGQNIFENMKDTIKFSVNQTDTEEVEREKIAKALKLGLVRYIIKTKAVDKVNVTFDKPKTLETKTMDDWDFWYFRTSVSSYFNGQESNDFIYLQSSFSANRVTDESKINFQISNNYNESNFNYGTTNIKSISRSQNFRAYYISAITNHWSWGIWTRGFRSTYSNIDYSFNLSPGIEFNVFPYSMSNQKQLRIEYRVEPNYNKYLTETIYLKKKEWLWAQSLELTYEVIETWGNIEFNLDMGNYLHDFDKYQIEFDGGFSLKIVKGLSIDFNGGYSKIQNQMALPRGGASLEEVLLQRRELQTQYSYWGNVGVSYSFGSIYNNVVNSRFGS